MIKDVDCVCVRVKNMRELANFINNCWKGELITRCDEYLEDNIMCIDDSMWSFEECTEFDMHPTFTTSNMEGYTITVNSGKKAELYLSTFKTESGYDVVITAIGGTYESTDIYFSQYLLNLLHINQHYATFYNYQDN